MQQIEIIQQCILTLALSLLIVWVSRLPKYSLFFSSLLFVLALLGCNLIPIMRGSSLVEMLRGIIGDVSITSGALLLFVIANQFDFSENRKPVLHWAEKTALFVIGLILYASTLGFLSVDIYHFGYLSLMLLGIIAVVILLLLLANRALGFIWLIALIGYYYHLQHSNNILDYFYDPLLWLVMLYCLFGNLITSLRRPSIRDTWQV